jgi:hypothetical protein
LSSVSFTSWSARAFCSRGTSRNFTCPSLAAARMEI